MRPLRPLLLWPRGWRPRLRADRRLGWGAAGPRGVVPRRPVAERMGVDKSFGDTSGFGGFVNP